MTTTVLTHTGTPTTTPTPAATARPASPCGASSPSNCASPSTPAPGSGCSSAPASPRSLATILVIAFAPADQLSYSMFTLAIGKPMSILLPLIALLSVTAEWTQRSGLTTFTLVPHRGRVILAKGIAMLLVGIVAMVLAFPLGALGNLAGTAIHGVDPVWDQNVTDLAYYALANTLLMAAGFMLGVLIRASAGAIVDVLHLRVRRAHPPDVPGHGPGLVPQRPALGRPELQPRRPVPRRLHAEQWAQLGVTSAAWLVVPLALGVVTLLRSEVK